jgi:hypothetical protein
MNSPIITRPIIQHTRARRPASGAGRWSRFLPILAFGVAAIAWIAVLGFQIFSGLEWNRASALLGLLLPICALGPFTALFRKKSPLETRSTGAAITRRPALPRRRIPLTGAPLDSIPTVLPLWRLFNHIARTGRTDYPVVDETGQLVGVIALSDLPHAAAREVLGWLIAADIMMPVTPAKPAKPA